MKIRIPMFIEILLFVASIVCFALCIAQKGENAVLLSLGFLCAAVAIVLNRIVTYMNRKDKR